jgi:hypothetical protein
MVVDEKTAEHKQLQVQVDRILRSDEFRGSEVLRKLLVYLTDKAVSGEADHLKEYTVAIDALGKPASYDPQHNSTVRIQVGRLRQKLAEYYRGEGKEDECIVDLPKGRFRLSCEHRVPEPMAARVPEPVAAPLPVPVVPIEKAARPGWLLLVLGVVLGLGIASLVRFLPGERSRAGEKSVWTPELDALWGPFVRSRTPLIVSIEDPLFAEISSNPGIYYRDRSMNRWSDVQQSPAVKKLSEVLGKGEIQPSRYYTAFGEAESSFLLGRLLGSRGQLVSMTRTSQLSWQQLSDNNVIFVGVQNLFFEQLQGMPVATELIANLNGVHNTHPEAGEPSLFSDEYSTAPTEQGVLYALVTHVSGPMGRSEVESFTANRSAGYVGAVQSFTNPESAKELVSKLKGKNGGSMPRSYQVLFKVRFKESVPTQTTYVLSRVLH